MRTVVACMGAYNYVRVHPQLGNHIHIQDSLGIETREREGNEREHSRHQRRKGGFFNVSGSDQESRGARAARSTSRATTGTIQMQRHQSSGRHASSKRGQGGKTT